MEAAGVEHLSQMSLDLLLLGDLGESESAGVHRHLGACADCRARYETMQRDAELFDREVLPRTRPGLVANAAAGVPSARAAATATARRGRRAAWGLGLAGLVAAAAAVLLAVRPGRNPDDLGGDLLAKGAPHLTVFARQGQRVFAAADGVRLRPHDAVRFAVDPGGHPFVMIASIDGAGQASIYLPAGGGGQQSVPVPPHQRFAAPSAIELDDATGPERIFALFSDRPLPAAEVVTALTRVGRGGAAAIRAARALDVPAAAAQASVLIEK